MAFSTTSKPSSSARLFDSCLRFCNSHLNMSFNVAPRAVGKDRKASVVSLRDPQFDARASFSGIQEEPSKAEFKPSLRLYLAFSTLAVITMMVALDGTSISVALPVAISKPELSEDWMLMSVGAGHIQQAAWDRHRSLLVRDLLSPLLHHLPTELRQLLPHLRPETHDHDWSRLFSCRSYRRCDYE